MRIQGGDSLDRVPWTSAGVARTQSSRPKSRRSGITLLEVIVAMSIFLFSIVAISQLVSIGTERALDVQFHSRASMLCQSKMAELIVGSEPMQSTPATAFTDEPEWQYEVDATDADITGLKNVRVTVKQELPGGRIVEVTLNRAVLDPTTRGNSFDKLTSAPPTTTGGTMP